jgi:HEPN domain-containing protein
MKETAKKWYKQAIHELEMAEKNIAIGGYDVASFLSHQVAVRVLAFFEAKWGWL